MGTQTHCDMCGGLLGDSPDDELCQNCLDAITNYCQLISMGIIETRPIAELWTELDLDTPPRP